MPVCNDVLLLKFTIAIQPSRCHSQFKCWRGIMHALHCLVPAYSLFYAPVLQCIVLVGSGPWPAGFCRKNAAWNISKQGSLTVHQHHQVRVFHLGLHFYCLLSSNNTLQSKLISIVHFSWQMLYEYFQGSTACKKVRHAAVLGARGYFNLWLLWLTTWSGLHLNELSVWMLVFTVMTTNTHNASSVVQTHMLNLLVSAARLCPAWQQRKLWNATNAQNMLWTVQYSTLM